MRKFVSGIALSALILGTSPIAFADTSATYITIQIDGQNQQFDQKPIIVNNYTLVPLRGIFEKLGATVTWDGQSQTVSVVKGTKNIQIAIGSPFAVINGFQQKIDDPAQIVNGNTMVPLRFISEALGADVQWVNATRTVLISTQSTGNQTNSVSTNAQTDQLTYQKAVDLAMQNSDPVKEALASIDRGKKVLDNSATNVQYVPAAGGNTAATKIYSTYALDNINYQSAQKNYSFIQDSLSYAVKSAYNGVLQAQEAKNLADLQLENAAIQQQVAQAKYQNGLLGQTDLQQVEKSYTSAQSDQAAAEKTVENAYQQLDQLLGLTPNEHPTLLDSPQMNLLGQVDLNSKVTQAESESPFLWEINHNIDLAQLGLKLYTFNDPTADPYQAKEIDVNLATYNAADQQKQLDQTVRSLYYQIKGLEDQYNSLQANLASAEATLKKTQALYDNGMAVQADLMQAQLGVESIKQKLMNLAVQHDDGMLAFSTPWVVVSSSSSSSSSSSTV